MSDRIVLRGVRAIGRHGVLEQERRDGQLFAVDVLVEADLAVAGRTDQLAHTINYAAIADQVVARITGEPVDLIERLAELVAADVLEAHPLAEAVEVTVHKPQAPIGHPFDDVLVQIRRERGVPVVLALGANLGDRLATLTEAVADLARIPGFTPTAVSPLVETDPVGGPEHQPAYLNAVVLGRSTRGPEALLRSLHAIEQAHGRVRATRWGARTLDLDLIEFGLPGTDTERLGDSEALTLPHPRAAERAFVLAPWAAVDPTARLRLGASASAPVAEVADLLAAADRSGLRPGPAWSPGW